MVCRLCCLGLLADGKEIALFGPQGNMGCTGLAVRSVLLVWQQLFRH